MLTYGVTDIQKSPLLMKNDGCSRNYRSKSTHDLGYFISQNTKNLS